MYMSMDSNALRRQVSRPSTLTSLFETTYLHQPGQQMSGLMACQPTQPLALPIRDLSSFLYILQHPRLLLCGRQQPAQR